ncbi:hypothetical protein Tco_0379382 [Tanacetum coccineum]
MIDMAELVAEGAPDIDEGLQAVPAPIQAPQPPPAAGPARTLPQRVARLEEEVHRMQEALGEQRGYWIDLAGKKSTTLVKYRSSGILCVL